MFEMPKLDIDRSRVTTGSSHHVRGAVRNTACALQACALALAHLFLFAILLPLETGAVLCERLERHLKKWSEK